MDSNILNKETTDVSQNLTIKEKNGKLLLPMVEKVLTNLGISPGLPPSNKWMDYNKLDIRSFKIINRMLVYASKNQTSNFTELFKDKIQVVEIVNSQGKAMDIHYILAKDFNDILRDK